MPFTPKDWQNSPSTGTSISAEALEDMETRLARYAEDSASIYDATLTSQSSDVSITIDPSKHRGFSISYAGVIVRPDTQARFVGIKPNGAWPTGLVTAQFAEWYVNGGTANVGNWTVDTAQEALKIAGTGFTESSDHSVMGTALIQAFPHSNRRNFHAKWVGEPVGATDTSRVVMHERFAVIRDTASWTSIALTFIPSGNCSFTGRIIVRGI